MELFDVYPLFDITPVKGEGTYVFDKDGKKYLDLYGGHAVISIGHSHPAYVNAIFNQVRQLGFYSNSIKNPFRTQCDDHLAMSVCFGSKSGHGQIFDVFGKKIT